MRKIKTYLYLIATSILIVSCSNNEKQKEGSVLSTTDVSEKDKVNEDVEVLTLDNGKKWKVNDEMTPYIIKSEQLAKDFDGDNYNSLADELMELNNNLISNCTMSGPSHDELHKWLHPHIELIKKLEAQENQEDSEAVVEEIKHSFEVFHEYFE